VLQQVSGSCLFNRQILTGPCPLWLPLLTSAGLPHLRLPADLQGPLPHPPRDLPVCGLHDGCAAHAVAVLMHLVSQSREAAWKRQLSCLGCCAGLAGAKSRLTTRLHITALFLSPLCRQQAGGGAAAAGAGQAGGAVDRQAALLAHAAPQVSGGRGAVGAAYALDSQPRTNRLHKACIWLGVVAPPACCAHPASTTAMLSLLPPSQPASARSSKVKIFVNSETTEKIYTSGEHLCPMDGFVCFRNSHLIRCGAAPSRGGL